MNPLKIVTAALLLSGGKLAAQIISPGAPIDGSFHVTADDRSAIFLNGAEVFRNEFQQGAKVAVSGPLTLKSGDHLVFRVHNKGGPKGLLVQFVSSDGKILIQFPRAVFRVLADPQASNFRDSDYRDGRTAQPGTLRLPVTILP